MVNAADGIQCAVQVSVLVAAMLRQQEASIAGSADAQVQLANLLAQQPKHYTLAVQLYSEAAQV